MKKENLGLEQIREKFKLAPDSKIAKTSELAYLIRLEVDRMTQNYNQLLTAHRQICSLIANGNDELLKRKMREINEFSSKLIAKDPIPFNDLENELKLWEVTNLNNVSVSLAKYDK